MKVNLHNKNKKAVMAAAVIAIAAAILVMYAGAAGFWQSRQNQIVRTDYRGNESRNNWSGSYRVLDGTMSRHLQPAGEMLNIQTETESGSISIEILDEAGNVIFEEKNIGTEAFDVEVSGEADVRIEAKEHKGSFRIRCLADVASQEELESGQIFLYGEAHDTKSILEQELELWNTYYHKYGMRDLFVEYSYCGAGFLNLWMESDDDELLERLYQDFEGTLAHSRQVIDFFKQIKKDCPETVFHGTDIEFQYQTTGKRFLEYLEEHQQEQSETYRLAQEAVRQGEYYFAHEQTGELYRENMLVQNFIREFDSLDGACVMGIYGAAHTDVEAMDFTTKSIPCMANQLNDVYQDALHADRLTISYTADTIQLGDKQYPALHYAKEDVEGNWYRSPSGEIWVVEDAYEDFKENPLNGNMLPYEEYPPMDIETGQVFAVKLIAEDGSETWEYYRSDGNRAMGSLITEEFTIEGQ